MYGHATFVSNFRKCADFLRRVDRPALGSLRDGEHARLHAVHVGLEPCEARGQILRRNLGARATDQRIVAEPAGESVIAGATIQPVLAKSSE